MNLQRKSSWGAGSGLISVMAATEGGMVTATDINRTSVMNIRINRDRNFEQHWKNCGNFVVVQSDLFQGIRKNLRCTVTIRPITKESNAYRRSCLVLRWRIRIFRTFVWRESKNSCTVKQNRYVILSRWLRDLDRIKKNPWTVRA